MFSSSPALADLLVLANGDRLTGKLIKHEKRKDLLPFPNLRGPHRAGSRGRRRAGTTLVLHGQQLGWTAPARRRQSPAEAADGNEAFSQPVVGQNRVRL